MVFVDMANLTQWVGDQLHDILGISDKVIAEYFVGLARKASSVPDLVQKLVDTGTVEIDQKMTNFAKELFAQVGRVLIISLKWE